MDDQAIQGKRWLSRADAADHIGVSVRHLDKLVAAGKLRPSKPASRRVIFDRAELDSFMESQRASAPSM
jgi:excisionase family DNA binding protein